MTIENHALNLLVGEATPVDAILAQLVEKWLLQKIHLYGMKELLLRIGGQVMRWSSQCQIVGNVFEPRGLLCGDDHEMLVRKSIIDRGVVALIDKPGEMISNDVLDPRLVFDLQIKLL